MKDLLTNLITILPILFPVCAGILIAVSERKGEHIHSFRGVLSRKIAMTYDANEKERENNGKGKGCKISDPLRCSICDRRG